MLVVVDSSAFGQNPMVDLSQLDRWEAACRRRGHELVLPEIVLWELYEHYQAEERKFSNAVGAFNRARTRHRLEALQAPGPLTLEALRDMVAATGVRILPLTGEQAVEGLRDQVLQHGAGSTKSGHKVGAADSAWLRAAFSAAALGELVLVSGDVKAIAGVAEVLGVPEPQHVVSFPDLGRLIGISPASEDIQAKVEELLGPLIERQREALARDLSSRMTDGPMVAHQVSVDLEGVELQGGPFVLAGDFAEGELEIRGTLRLGFDHSWLSGIPWDQGEEAHAFTLEAEFGMDLDGDELFDLLRPGWLTWR
ncbi:MAG: hypothetical protein Q4G50_08820 [Corynebacterium sp.]|uniref:hypothetical protein n=1 Tax=Corynebacterium sp. TaxID=1720 RepID=UPI0026E0ACF3|nr:hypothetical protein [Corynebacterium sp.]MDO5670091.1 hypothetical protein [Corynebacterium sp.]